MKIKGYIGSISVTEIRGWVLNEDNFNERVSILLYINGIVTQEVIADDFRVDLQNSGKGDGKYGFKILGDFSKALEIKVIVKNTKIQIKKIKKSITLLMARQRSGTNVLRRCLSTHTKILSINELFDTGIYNNTFFDEYSHKYVELISEGKSDLIGGYYSYYFDSMKALKKPVTHLESFEKFVNFIGEVSPCENIIIDLKYNHIRVLHDFITPLTKSRPELFNIIERNNWKVLNLTRKNYVKSFVSGVLAQKSGLFVVDKNSHISINDNIEIKINVEHMLNSINAMKKEDEYVFQAFFNYKHYKQIDYLDMFDEEQNFNIDFIQSMSDFFGVENNFNREPLLKKLQNKALHELVLNYDEIVNSLKDTEFSKFLNES